MGLLTKAISVETGAEFQDELWTQFLSNARELPPTLDYPALLFKKIVDFFRMEKAALFFKLPGKNAYRLLASRGYDKTSANRMRLDEKATQSEFFKTLKKHKEALKLKEPPSWLKEFCSSREFGLFEELYWLPFVAEEKIIALILVSQWKDLEPPQWFKRFQAIQEEFSPSVWNSRKALRNSEGMPKEKFSREYLQNYCKQIQGTEAYIITLDLAPVIKQLNTMQGELQSPNHKSEIRDLFQTMAGPRQKILEAGKNRLLLILDRSIIPDSPLFIHQLSSSLPLLYQELKSSPALNEREFHLPRNDKEWDELIEALM